jgi:hypothetical protein
VHEQYGNAAPKNDSFGLRGDDNVFHSLGFPVVFAKLRGGTVVFSHALNDTREYYSALINTRTLFQQIEMLSNPNYFKVGADQNIPRCIENPAGRISKN